MNIVKASLEHSDFISNGLVSHFSRANQFFKYPKYNDKFEIMQKHIQRRIESIDKEHYYLVALEDMNPLGFINFSVSESMVGTILVVFANDQSVRNSLVEKAFEFGKEIGIRDWECEVFSYDTGLLELISKIGVSEQFTHYKITF